MMSLGRRAVFRWSDEQTNSAVVVVVAAAATVAAVVVVVVESWANTARDQDNEQGTGNKAQSKHYKKRQANAGNEDQNKWRQQQSQQNRNEREEGAWRCWQKGSSPETDR